MRRTCAGSTTPYSWAWDYDTNPIRIVLDPHGRTPDEAQILDERAPTIMVTLEDCDREWDCEEIIRKGKGTIDLEAVLEELAEEMGIENILVEGGGRTIASFLSGWSSATSRPSATGRC